MSNDDKGKGKIKNKLARSIDDGLKFGMSVMTAAGETELPLGAVAVAMRFMDDQFSRTEAHGWQQSKEMANEIYEKLKEEGLIPVPQVVQRGMAYED